MSEPVDQTTERTLEQRMTELAAKLQSVGAVILTQSYYGSGDSGGDYTLEATDGKGQAVDLDSDLESAAIDLCEDLISASGHDGYEINEGGGGTFTLNVSGSAELAHYDNYVEREESPTEMREPDSEDGPGEWHAGEGMAERFDHVRALLNEHGFSAIVAGYEGGGDSGWMSEIRLLDRDGNAVEVDDPRCAALRGLTMVGAVQEITRVGDDWRYVTTEKEMPIEEAIESLLWQSVGCCHHSGWENNEGGGGELVIGADGQIVLEHYDYIANEEHSTHEWTFEAPPSVELAMEAGPSM